MRKRINRRKYFLKGTIERYEFRKMQDSWPRAFFHVAVRNLRERSKDIVADLIVTWTASEGWMERYNKKVWNKKELGV